MVANPRHISELIEQSYMEKMFHDIDDMQTEEIAEEDINIADLQKMAREALVIKLVNLIMHQAVQERASDIHIEPHERELRVRYRVDGVLHDASSPPRHLHPAIISRIKIMAEMDIAERRLPQDGRHRIKLGGRSFDLRVSSIPTLHGESIVIRLLERSSGGIPLPDLGMREDTFAAFKTLLARPYGIILVTGPTGSGKSTTLHAALHEVYSPELKIITIEEPVEYELRRRQPDQRASRDRPHLRRRFAPHRAPRPGRDHGGRDPRLGDRGHRDPRRPDRPPGVQHRAHKRRGGRRSRACWTWASSRSWWPPR